MYYVAVLVLSTDCGLIWGTVGKAWKYKKRCCSRFCIVTKQRVTIILFELGVIKTFMQNF